MPAKLAYAQWVWGTNSQEQFITSCKELSSLGYKYFESVRAFIDTFKGDREAFKAITDEYDLHPISFYFHLSGDENQDIEDLKSRIDFVHYLGIKTICVQGCGRKNWSDEVLQKTLRVVSEYGRICKDYGILPSVHPHANTSIMYEKETDFIMQNTDPALIGFAPDTAHLLVSGCDPVAICERYKERISFTHIKDVKKPDKADKPVKSAGWQDGVEVICNFLELGEGDVDFDRVFKILKSVNYNGYLCVELDTAPKSNIASAKKNMEFMKAHWGRDI
jgi:inosose dehydratase